MSGMREGDEMGRRKRKGGVVKWERIGDLCEGEEKLNCMDMCAYLQHCQRRY